MEDSDVTVPCWCPGCREPHEEAVPEGQRQGPRVEGRLLRHCVACAVQTLIATERVKVRNTPTQP